MDFVSCPSCKKEFRVYPRVNDQGSYDIDSMSWNANCPHCSHKVRVTQSVSVDFKASNR